MNTIYQLPTWAETVLVICIALMLTSIGVWLMCKAVSEAVNAASRLETKRRTSETKALNKWQRLYEEEKQLRLTDVADLISKLDAERYLNSENMKEADKQIKDLLRQLKEKDALLSKVKVKDI